MGIQSNGWRRARWCLFIMHPIEMALKWENVGWCIPGFMPVFFLLGGLNFFTFFQLEKYEFDTQKFIFMKLIFCGDPNSPKNNNLLQVPADR